MSDDNTQSTPVEVTPISEVAATPLASGTSFATPAVAERIADTDRMALELAKANKRAALAQAEKALAQNETSELAYKYTVLQIYMKYGMNENDALGEDGTVMRGGAVQPAQGR